MKRNMLVVELQAHLGDREFDGDETLAIKNFLPDLDVVLDHFYAFVGSSPFVQGGIVAVIGESAGLVLSADPVVVKAIAISIGLCHRFNEGFGDSFLHEHLFLGVLDRM